MREIRQSGSEGGVADNGHPYPYGAQVVHRRTGMRESSKARSGPFPLLHRVGRIE
jgi:hypothetical protein